MWNATWRCRMVDLARNNGGLLQFEDRQSCDAMQADNLRSDHCKCSLGMHVFVVVIVPMLLEAERC